MRRRALVWVACGLLSAATAACGDDGGGTGFAGGDVGSPDAGDAGDTGDGGGGDDGGADGGLPEGLTCDGVAYEGEVEASPWATRVAGIAAYRYSGAATENVLRVEGLGADGGVLLVMDIRQVPEEGEGELPAGVMAIDFSAEGEGEGTLWTSGRELGDGYAVATRMQTPQGELRTEARFAMTRCAPEPDAEGQPGCVAPLVVGEGGVTVHDCGLDAWSQGAEKMPELVELLYVAPGGAGASMRRAGATTEAVLTVYGGGRVTPPATVEGWAQANGAGEILGSVLEARVSAAHLDLAWRRRVEAHQAYCEGLQEGGGLGSQQQGLTTRGQGLDPNPNNRSASLHKGVQDLNKKIASNAPIKEYRICVVQSAKCAKAKGDPHLETFDGVAYDFQGVGEYVLARSRRGEAFEVQARMVSVDPADPVCRSVSVVSRVAMTFAGEVWEADVTGAPVLLRGGEPVDLATLTLPEGWFIAQRDEGLSLVWPDGVAVVLREADVQVSVPRERFNDVEGLLGRFDDSGALYGADGTRYSASASFDVLYAEYGEGWRVTLGTTLFAYEDGQGPEDFHARALPESPLSVGLIPAAERAEAEASCAELGITDPLLLGDCVLDTYCGSPELGAVSAGKNSPSGQGIAGDVLVLGPGRWVLTPDALSARAPRSEGLCEADGEALVEVYEERAEVVLDAALAVDVMSPGEWEAAEAGAEVPEGARVRVVSARLADNDDAVPRLVRVTFPSRVLGVLATDARLEASEGALGAEGLGGGAGRGVEWGRDAVSLSEDRRTVTVRLDGRDGADQVRVVTEVQP